MHQQANGCPQHNGATNEDYETPSSSQQNGNAAEHKSPVPAMGKTDQDIVRLIGQHLKTIGLK